jgi:hypothetical protein
VKLNVKKIANGFGRREHHRPSNAQNADELVYAYSGINIAFNDTAEMVRWKTRKVEPKAVYKKGSDPLPS